MLLARLMAVVSSVPSELETVPAARSWSIATTPTPMITVTIAASIRVKPRRPGAARRAGLVKVYRIRVDIGFTYHLVNLCDAQRCGQLGRYPGRGGGSSPGGNGYRTCAGGAGGQGATSRYELATGA